MRQKRGIIKAQFTRVEKFMDDENNHNKSEILKSRLERVHKYFDDFETIQTEIESLDDSEEKVREEVENTYFNIIGRAKNIIKSTECSAISNVDPLKNVNLPRLNLPVFSGNFDSWLPFHDEFVNLIHHNKTLTNMQKFFYLRSSLRDESLRLIQCYQVSNENYLIAYDLLVERYQRTRRIVDSHINALLEIPCATKESAHLLRVITDGFYQHNFGS